LLSKAKIIGMTTTGAAKNSGLLQKLGAEAMIIEEAGQVLESHVLTAMTPNLKRLILLGELTNLLIAALRSAFSQKKFGEIFFWNNAFV
jgi:hypothetical protein